MPISWPGTFPIRLRARRAHASERRICTTVGAAPGGRRTHGQRPSPHIPARRAALRDLSQPDDSRRFFLKRCPDAPPAGSHPLFGILRTSHFSKENSLRLSFFPALNTHGRQTREYHRRDIFHRSRWGRLTREQSGIYSKNWKVILKARSGWSYNPH